MQKKALVIFEKQESPNSDDEEVLSKGLSNAAVRKKGADPVTHFAIFIKNEAKETVGGVTCFTMYGSLYVDMLWIDESLRGRGLGRQLLEEAEEVGRARKCTFATLETMDWEGLPFYLKQGYGIEFSRTGYQKESTMYILKKIL